MRAKQRKLLGILGALAVPIALVVGLYTDSGDLFKGYLTFQQNPDQQAITNAQDTSVLGYLDSTLTGGITLNGSSVVAAPEAFFSEYFKGSATNQAAGGGDPLFDPSTQCIAGANFESDNLESQYQSLRALLADRTDLGKIQEFGAIKVFYELEYSDNRKLVRDNTLSTDTLNNSGFVSYEDVQKLILVNYMAYKEADCDSVPKYHVNGSTTEAIVSLSDLENVLFKYSPSLQERQVSKTALGSEDLGVSATHTVAFANADQKQSLSEDLTALTDSKLSLRNNDKEEQYSNIKTIAVQSTESITGLNFANTPNVESHTKFLVSLNDMLAEIRSAGDLNGFFSRGTLQSAEANAETARDLLAAEGDLAFDINEKIESYNANLDALKTAIQPYAQNILGLDSDSITLLDIQEYISYIDLTLVTNKFTGTASPSNDDLNTAVDAINLDGTPLVNAKTNVESVDLSAEEALAALADAQAQYLLSLQKSIKVNIEDADPLAVLKNRQQLMLNLAKIIELIKTQELAALNATIQNGNLQVASTYINGLANAEEFTADLFTLVDQARSDTQSHFSEDGANYVEAQNFADPTNDEHNELETAYTTLVEAKGAYEGAKSVDQLKNTVNAPFIAMFNSLTEIVEQIELKTSMQLEVLEFVTDELDIRAGSFENGGFPDSITITSDMRDAQVDLALIQLEPTSGDIAPPVTTDVLTSLIQFNEVLLAGVDKAQGQGKTQETGEDFKFSVMYSQDVEQFGDDFTKIIEVDGLNADSRNFRAQQDITEIESRINPNYTQILLVKVSSKGEQEHNFIEGSITEHLENQYKIFIFKDTITPSAELFRNLTTNAAADSFVVGEPISISTTFNRAVTLPHTSITDAASYAFIAQTDECGAEDTPIISELSASVVGNSIQANQQQPTNPLVADTYRLCFAIYDDTYQPTGITIDIVEPTPEDPGAEGGEDQPGAISEVDSTNAIASDVTLELTGENLSTDEADYQLARQDNAVAATAINVTQDNQDDTRYIVQFGEVLPGSYQLAYKRERQEGFVNVDNLKVLNPNNNSVIGASNPEISFECLSDYTYNATLKNTVDNTVQQFTDIECNSNVAVFKVEQALSKGVRYTLEIVIVDELGNELEGLFDSHRFSTSNNFLLTPEQAAVLDFTCGRQIAESKDANGIPIPGKKNVVIKGTKTNCAVTNPFPQAGISAGYMVKIGANTPQTDAVAMQAIQGGFAATNILVPAESSDYYIYVLVPGTNSNEFVKTNSFVTPYESNGSVDKETAEGDIEDLIDVSMPNTIEIGESIDLEIDIPENLDVHMMVVRYQGNEDDRDTRDFSGPVFIYCQEDITDNFEKNRDRRKIDRICDRFYEDDILEGPDTIEIEDFDTSRIGAEGLYDIKIDLFVDAATLPAEALSKGDSTTAYAQGIEIKQLRLTIEEAFEAENRQLGGGSRAFIDGRAMLASGVNFQYPPMHTAIPVQTQQCQTVFRDLNVSHQICKDIMYLYEQKLYSGVRMGNNIVSGVNDAAVRAHLFSFIERVLKTYRKVPNYGINYQALYKFQDVKQYLNDPVQQWWLAPAATLATYGFVQGDANYNLNPFGRVTQAQAAKLIGMATGLIPPELQQKSPWYADIVAQYITYGMNLNPNAPATLGDLVVILSRSIQIMKNPNLFNTINQFAGNTHVGLY